MDKFLNIVTPDDVETQVLSWGSFQWMNEPRVTGTSNMAVGIGRIHLEKAIQDITMRVVMNLFISFLGRQNRLLKQKMV